MKKILKKSFRLLLLTLIFSCISNTLVMATSDLPPVYSEGAILMDGITGEILYSKNEHVQYEPASTTKVMTALVVLENANLSDKVTIGEKPPLVDGSAIGIEAGEVYTVEELLTALLLESANDCAEALAEHIGGSNEGFAVLMNKKAVELGAFDTTFKNPSGLHEEGHLTTAYDLALIMKAAIQNEEYVRISQIDSHLYVNHPYSDGSEKWAINRNQLFNEYTNYLYEYAYTGKNGYTPEANHTYTASAVKGDQVLVAAFLNATDKDNFYLNIGPLFDYGFENFETVKIINEGDVLGSVEITEGEYIDLISSKDIYYTKTRNEASVASNKASVARNEKTVSYDVNYNFSSESFSNINEINIGDSITTGSVNVNGKTIASVELVSGTYYKKTLSPSVIFKNLNLIKIAISILIVFIIIILLLNLKLYFKRKRLRKRRRIYNSKKYR